MRDPCSILSSDVVLAAAHRDAPAALSKAADVVEFLFARQTVLRTNSAAPRHRRDLWAPARRPRGCPIMRHDTHSARPPRRSESPGRPSAHRRARIVFCVHQPAHDDARVVLWRARRVRTARVGRAARGRSRAPIAHAVRQLSGGSEKG